MALAAFDNLGLIYFSQIVSAFANTEMHVRKKKSNNLSAESHKANVAKKVAATPGNST